MHSAHAIVQAVILGVLTGGVYALMASGQTLIFGVMRVVNLAQGALVLLAAYVAYSLTGGLGVDPFLAIGITTPLMFGFGVAIQLLFVRPLGAGDRAELSLLVTFAVALGIEGLLTVLYNTTYRSIEAPYADASWSVLGFQVPAVRAYAFALSVVLLAALIALLRGTRVGRAIRATVQNPTSARLLGVDVDRIGAVGFGLGAATAAAAGSVFGLVYPFNPSSHYELIARLLTIVVLGGLGSIGGAIVAAAGMGVISSVVAVTVSPVWADFAFFVVLLAVLLLRPRGLFGPALRGAA
ncbi:MAG TPA: branched-chain amino acid ABC transporter permease [Streptosporangiaceae bacterium]|nr:branched-chain amino acid ABC transporter permease [Streptosporangiaceae bacterium]